MSVKYEQNHQNAKFYIAKLNWFTVSVDEIKFWNKICE